jgi:hypothetical protein
MAEVTFREALDWLGEHKGRRVVVEVGCKDPRAEDADFAVLQVHATLGAVYIVDDRRARDRREQNPFRGRRRDRIWWN